MRLKFRIDSCDVSEERLYHSPRSRIGPAALLFVLFSLGCGQTHAAGLLQGWPAGALLELRDHSVSVEIEDRIARTEVTQVFQNIGNRTVEARYTFTLPEGASIANFSMWINGKEMVGEVVERQRAKEIYESYKPNVRDPGLIEKTGDNRFEMRIFPIGPNASQKIRLRYYQELASQGNSLLYAYPLKMDDRDQKSGREIPSSRRAEKFKFALSVSSSYALAGIESLTHGSLLKSERRSDQEWSASLEAAGIELERDLSVCLMPKQPLPALDVIASRVGNADGFFRLVISPDAMLQPEEKGQEFVFLLDISGSMGEEGRLARAREMINAVLGKLSPEDRFDIISFSSQARALFGSAKPKDATALKEADKFLAGLEPKEFTYLDTALELANTYQQGERPLKIVLVSDGLFDLDNPAWLFKRVSEFSKFTRLCYVPLAEKEGFTMLQQFLKKNTGWARPLTGNDIKSFVVNLVAELKRPILYDAHAVEFMGAEVYDVAPAILPCLHLGESVTVYGRYRSGGKLTATLRGVLGTGPIKQQIQTILPSESKGRESIERLWACRRAEDLVALSYNQTDKSQQETLWQIVRLAERYSIVTDYTSFLVLENNEEYQRWQVERSNLLRSTAEGQESEEHRRRLETLQVKVQELSKEREKNGMRIQSIDLHSPALKSKSQRTLSLELPRPFFAGTPKDIRAKNLRKPGPPRPRELPVAPGVMIRNVALNKPVTCSDPEPIIGDITQVTDGVKDADMTTFVELGPGKQWVQIDLGEEYLIRYILLWHNFYAQRVYYDVIVQVSNDKTFEKGVTTLFNNDYDNSSGFGIGKDEQYIENYEGELITVKTPLRARYVRLYTNGNTDEQMNHYTEVEVFAASREQ
jgi:Ca-activated chloride channel homolog